MHLLLLVPLALAGSKWDGAEADVSATAVLDASPEALRSVLTDDHVLGHVLPEHCVLKIDYDGAKDPAANVRITYDVGWMHRRVDASPPVARTENVIEVEHLGNKGFFTRWTLSPAEGGTEVEMVSYLNPPPKPFRGYYFTRVRPEWVACYVEALERLEARATSR